MEVAIHSFKSETPYIHTERRKRGRVSLRLRTGRLDDPVELRWIRSGISVGSSIDYGKISYTNQITPRLSLRLRSRLEYEDSDVRLFGNLEYKLNAQTTVHALAGNRINILSGPATYPGGPRSDEKGKGLLVFVEHLF